MKVTYKNDIIDFIESRGTKVTVNDHEYFYLPFWYSRTDQLGIFEEYSFDELPKELTSAIKNFREDKSL